MFFQRTAFMTFATAAFLWHGSPACAQEDATMVHERSADAALVVSQSFLVASQSQPGNNELIAWFNAARKLKAEGDTQGAVRLFEKVLAEVPRVWGEGDTAHATVLNHLALLYSDLGQHARAEPFFLRCLAIREAKLGKDHVDTARVLCNLAIMYLDTDQHARARPLFARSLSIREAKLGKDHEDVATTLMGLAGVDTRLGEYARAEQFYQRSLAIREARLGKDHPETATNLNNLAALYADMGQFVKAETLYRRSLTINESKFGKEHLETALSLYNLATLYRDIYQFAAAEPLFQRSLAIQEAKLGKNHPEVASTLRGMAMLYYATEQYTRAEPLLRRSLEIREARFGKDHPLVATIVINLAGIYRAMGRYAQAEPLYQRGREIAEAKLGKEHLDTADAINGLASLYQDAGFSTKAEPLFHRCLQIYEAKVGKDHPLVANSLATLGRMHRSRGEYVKAEPLFLRSLGIREAKLGKDHPHTAFALNDLAQLYADLGQYARAEPLYRRSLDINEVKFGKDHSETAACLNNLAYVYYLMKDNARSEPLFLRSLQIFEARNQLKASYTLNNLAALYANMGQYKKAETLHRRSLEIREARLGKDHPQTAQSLSNLAVTYWNMGDYAKAAPLHRRSLEIREAKLGKDHPDTARSLHDLAINCAAQREWAQAVDLFDKNRRAKAAHLASFLPALTEQEQLAFLETKFVQELHNALALALIAPREATTPAAAWALNGKGVAQQSMAEQALLARDAHTPKTRQLANDLKTARAQLAAQVNRPPQPGLEAPYQKDLQNLKAREQDLAEKLARAVGRPYRANPWVTLDELRGKLGPKTAFVDIARFAAYDFKSTKTTSPHYFAWITPPRGQGEVQLMDLGEADAIDQLVDQTRKTLLLSARSITKVGEVEATLALQKPLKDLSAKVLHPLLPKLEKYQEWIVCPDGALWLTPWNALLLPDGKFAVEKYLIRHVVSGRDLVLELPRAQTGSAYLFADPNYDLSPGKVMAVAGELRGLGAPSLLGQRLHGTIGAWKVSFEFLQGEVVIRDEDDNGTVAGKGTWKQQGNTLTMQTSVSQFEGAIAASEISGQRSKRNADGTMTRDTFRMGRPRGDGAEVRSTGAVHGTLPRVPRLPGTALEAESVRPKLQQWLGQEPKVYLDAQASESMVKAINNPRVLCLATHGYFMPTQEIATKDRSGLDPSEGQRSAALLDKKGQPIENPLLRCGLLLAGCNQRGAAKGDEDDGILTGLEIVGLNLNGCELVVLSACETGLGDVRNGEGVAGLRQAFQLAGAKGVLASLWQVPDRETALLMNTFYGELTKGRSHAAALQQAQLQRLASRRNQFGAAHPFYWAAFTMTSRGAD